MFRYWLAQAAGSGSRVWVRILNACDLQTCNNHYPMMIYLQQRGKHFNDES